MKLDDELAMAKKLLENNGYEIYKKRICPYCDKLVGSHHCRNVSAYICQEI